MYGKDAVGARWLGRIESAAGAAVTIWLQVVGLVTTQVLHHVIHALPVFVLLVLPRNRWVRLTSMLTGFMWVFMLAVITPMIHHAILEGGLWRDRGVLVWLAPIAALLSAVWAALSLALLSGKAWLLPWFTSGFASLIPVLACLRPLAYWLFEWPLQAALAGSLLGIAVLAAELVLMLAMPWYAAARLTGRTDLRPDYRVLAWQALFWALFLACMLVGLLPSANP